MNQIENILSNTEEEESFSFRCPSCGNIIKEVNISENVDIISGTTLLPTLICDRCRSDIILSQELIEKIKKSSNDKETDSRTERNSQETE